MLQHDDLISSKTEAALKKNDDGIKKNKHNENCYQRVLYNSSYKEPAVCIWELDNKQ